MSQNNFNPNSFDAQMAKVLTLLETQAKKFDEKCADDKEAFASIMAKQDKTNGRVLNLEEWRTFIKGKVAAISIGCSAFGTFIGWYLTSK